MDNFKYAIFTDMIYQSIFREKSREYRQVLKLKSKEKIRDTFYTEILDLVASYECGLAAMIRDQAQQLGRKLTNWEVNDLFFCVCKFHSFEDGNKRLEITLSVQFLLINGYLAVAQTFFRETENISYHVAAGHIDKDLLHDILDSIMRGNFDENEDVKFRYYAAIAEE